MSDEHAPVISRPKNLLFSNVAFELKPEDIPDMLVEAIVGVSTLNWPSGLKILFKVIGIEGKTSGELAYQLLYEVLLKVVKRRINRLPGARLRRKETKLLVKQLVVAVADAQDIVDYRLFESPQELKAIPTAKETFKAWLQEHIKGSVRDEDYVRYEYDMLSRFESDVVTQFFYELAENQDKYRSLKSFSKDNPLYEQYKREIGKRAYFEWLAEQPEKRLLGEDDAPRLEEVYIPPRAYYEEKPPSSRREQDNEDKSKTNHYILDLENKLDAWLAKADPQDTVRVVSGGPGSGKSSFVTIFAAKHAALDDINVLVVKLHRIGHNFESNLGDAIERVIENDGLLAENPIDSSGNEPWLIIFDGLDELEALENGKNVADVFYRQVERYILDKNQAKDEPRFYVLLSGRTLIVQSVQSQFKHEAVFELMPFYISPNYRERNNWLKDKNHVHDEHALLEHDQRDAWWDKYGEAIGKAYDGLPKELASHDLAEITAQPLLNYLVAMSYERGNLDFSANPSLNEIYKDLLDSVFDREKGKRNSPTRQLDLDRFIRFFEEVARVVWHGNGRTTTFQEIEEARQDNTEISEVLDALPSDGGTFSLLAAFYMRQAERSSKTLEFTHKSFGEYLTARRLVAGLRDMQAILNVRQRGGMQDEALKQWAELCGQTRIDAYLLEFVRCEIALQDINDVHNWQAMLCDMFDYALREGVPLRSELPTLKEQNRQARNAEEALLVMLNGCARVTEKRFEIPLFQEERTALGLWLHKTRGQRKGLEFVAALACLGWLSSHRQSLNCQDLHNADLSNAYLVDADLRNADLFKADFFKADLRNAYLIDAGLFKADLSNTDLSNTNLFKADLSNADLRDADLRDADLRNANLSNADLSNADLAYANIERYQLKQTDFSVAKNQDKLNIINAPD